MRHLYTIFVVAVLIGIVVFLYEGPEAPIDAQQGITYSNDEYGISFIYPEGYVLEEGERGDAHRRHYAIVLIREEDSAIPENGEGPTAITVDIYQNNLDQQPLISWLKRTNTSNFKLSPDGLYASTTVDSIEAVQYRWSGLYEGETTAFRHAENIIAVSVTSLTPEDKNISVYRGILRSIDLREIAAL